MNITRTSPVSGITRTMDLDVTQEQLDALEHFHIQNVLGHLSADDREFILTGITPDEWESLWDSDVPYEESDAFEFFTIDKGIE